MKLYRVIDRYTGLFKRDDFIFIEENEIGLDVEPAQGLFQPKWDGEKWIEGATEIPIPAAEPQKSDEELLQELSSVVQQLKERGLI